MVYNYNYKHQTGRILCDQLYPANEPGFMFFLFSPFSRLKLAATGLLLSVYKWPAVGQIQRELVSIQPDQDAN